MEVVQPLKIVDTSAKLGIKCTTGVGSGSTGAHSGSSSSSSSSSSMNFGGLSGGSGEDSSGEDNGINQTGEEHQPEQAKRSRMKEPVGTNGSQSLLALCTTGTKSNLKHIFDANGANANPYDDEMQDSQLSRGSVDEVGLK